MIIVKARIVFRIDVVKEIKVMEIDVQRMMNVVEVNVEIGETMTKDVVPVEEILDGTNVEISLLVEIVKIMMVANVNLVNVIIGSVLHRIQHADLVTQNLRVIQLQEHPIVLTKGKEKKYTIKQQEDVRGWDLPKQYMKILKKHHVHQIIIVHMEIVVIILSIVKSVNGVTGLHVILLVKQPDNKQEPDVLL
tara:strand:+ start:732 stop:1307 length:576 start_codon:yes stop_codon:yes gene_type:complete